MDTTRCYKFRLDPTPAQEQAFVVFAGCRRWAWNWALWRKREVYKATGKGIGYNALAAELALLKKTDAPFLKDCHSQVLQQTLMDMDKAFKAFFEKRARFPRLKSRKRSPHAFRIPQNVSIVGERVSVPKVGLVKARFHRPMEGTVKSATIKQETDGHWYVVFVSHVELPDVAPFCDQPCGIDLGLSSFVTLDNGAKVEPPKFYRRGQRKLKRLQRQLSRCQKASKNRAKAKARVARQHNKTASRRADFLHKLSHGLVARYDTICVEDLNLKGLTRTKLAKSFHDAALGNFLRMLEYKSLWNVGQVVKVGRWFPSSKTCHCCQNIQPLELSDRQWTCAQCSVIHDRDHNAAINILSEGLRLLAVGTVCIVTSVGYNMPMENKNATRLRNLATKRKESGLCIRCGEPARPAKIFCASCASEANRRWKESRVKFRESADANSHCTKCRRPRVGESSVCEWHYLQNCADKSLGSTRFAEILKGKLQSQDFKCYYTGVPLELGINASIDHRLSVSNHPELRHEVENVVWCTKSINMMKHDLDEDDFLMVCSMVNGKFRSTDNSTASGEGIRLVTTSSLR